MMTTSRRDFLRISAAAGLAGYLPRFDQAAAAPKASGKTILMLGGTGFLGPHVVEVAKKHGHTITLFNRGKTHPQLFPDLEKLHGDRRKGDLKALEGRKWDAVVDTSARVVKEVRATATLLKDAVGQYVFISSLSVFPDTSKPVLDESAPVATIDNPDSEDVDANYGALKALCEKEAEKILPGRVANVRPGLIVGPGDESQRYTYWPVRVARGGEVLAPGTPEDPVQYIDARDLGEWIVKVIEDKTMGVFNAVGPKEPLGIGAMLDACNAAGGKKATFTWVDAKFLAQNKVKPWEDMPVWIPPGGKGAAALSQVSCKKAIGKGLTFRSPEDTAKATLEWFQSLSEEKRKNVRGWLKPEREAEVLAAWHAKTAAK